MNITLEMQKKQYITFGIQAIIGLLIGGMAKLPWWALVLYLGIDFLTVCTKVQITKGHPVVWAIPILILSAGFTLFCIQFLILTNEDFMKTTEWKIFLNLLLVLCFSTVILVISNRVRIACLVSHILLLAFGFVDYFVYSFRQNEFTFGDILGAGTGLSVASEYRFSLDAHAGIVLLLSLVVMTFVSHISIQFSSRLHLAILGILSVIAMALFVKYCTIGVNTETWERKGTYRNGYLLNFCLEIRDSRVSDPEGYSQKEVIALEQQYGKANDEIPSEPIEPTIICIMNESFADLSVLGEIETNQEVTPFLDSLTNNTIKGYALSSVFGAKTPNSEWEFMTGNSMTFLPEGSVVYQQYLEKDPHSLVSILKNDGYKAVAMHPYFATGWSRNTVYPRLGFDEMYFMDDFDTTNILRKYITDRELYQKIIQRYEDKPKDEKLFIMSVTMQNHGGYGEKYSNFKEDTWKQGLSYTDVNQYLSLIRESDRALEELIGYFQGIQEPVEIVFFGDHQPGLNSAFYQLMNGKGLAGLTQDEVEQLYKVPFFIWTNYESETAQIPITSLNYLSTMALEKANIQMPAYHRFLSEMMDAVPAINSRGYYSREKAHYLHIKDATGAEKEWIDKYHWLQYNEMFDGKRRSEIFFPYIKE